MTLFSALRSTLFPSSHPRILFLHGFTRSGPAFSAQTQHLQSALRTLAPTSDFHFPNATIPLQPSFESNIDGTYAWWRKCDESGSYVGLEDTMRFLGNYLDYHGPFAGVVGFSQGACLSALLAGALENGVMKSEMRCDHGKLGFVVAISGYRPATREYDRFLEGGVGTPVLGVMGRGDTIVEPERSMGLIGECAKAEVYWHDKAHVVPRDKESVGRIVEFVGSHLGDWKEVEGREQAAKGGQ